MKIIGILVWMGISILVAMDARTHQITTSDRPYSINNGAVAWFFFCVIVPMIALPYFLFRRRKLMHQRGEGD